MVSKMLTKAKGERSARTGLREEDGQGCRQESGPWLGRMERT